MIVAERKPFDEIKTMLAGCRKVFILGCDTCVSVCMAGGKKEVGLLASQLRMSFKKDGKDIQIDEDTVERQCNREYMELVLNKLQDYDLVVSMACGAGVQLLADLSEPLQILPGVNTRFIGMTPKDGTWEERCRACGDCVLGETAGICPVTVCAKGILNGPCGGTDHGKCEVDKEKNCAWTLIYRRLEKMGKLDNIRKDFPPRNHLVQCHPAKQVHEVYKGE
ncbi:MAG: methylenetetrahydrofolate reductase C-terminal domain-containing protein [Deltaproteobacteria bacterium]|nr:methylenetetrahydrofolate reductase C-terminal domain-containing protein [Deltaproteobacteria bacterium]